MWRPKRISPSGRVRRPVSFRRESIFVRVRRFVFGVACCVISAAFGTGVFFGALQVRHFVYESDFFRIDNDKIRIAGASATLQADARARLAGLLSDCESNLIRLDTAAVEAGMAGLPRARAARVSKVYPQGLAIRFFEREPLVLVNLDKPYLVDGDGIVLAAVRPGEAHGLGLPVLTGVHGASIKPGDAIEQPRLGEVLGAVAFLREHDQKVDRQIAEWNISGMQEVTAILRSGASVRFGAEAPLDLLDKLSAALVRKPDLMAQADYIDLRMNKQVVYNIKGQR
jgi:cell division septal protein FtsQ